MGRKYKAECPGGNKAKRRKRRALIKRDGDWCQSCGITLSALEASGQTLTVDHIHPHSLGGTWRLENLQLLCTQCNQEKANQTNYKKRSS